MSSESSGNPFLEQRELESGTAIVVLADRDVLSVSGQDRLSWLDSLTSQRLTDLVPGESAETLLLDPSGRVEYAIRVVDDGETAWLLLDPGAGAGLYSFLDRMRFMLRVEVADRGPEFATVGTLGGPPAGVAVRGGIPLVWVDPWRDIAVGGWQYAVTDSHPASAWTYSESLVERDRVGELDRPQVPEDALEALRIAAWRPRQAHEVDATSIPHELDWLRSAVHLNKGCYRGQETVAKVHNLGHPPRRLVFLHLDGSETLLPAPGDEVRLGETVVGRVTSAGRHWELGPIALAVVKRSADPTAALTVVTAEGEIAATQELIVPPEAGAAADVPRLPRLGAVRR